MKKECNTPDSVASDKSMPPPSSLPPGVKTEGGLSRHASQEHLPSIGDSASQPGSQPHTPLGSDAGTPTGT